MKTPIEVLNSAISADRREMTIRNIRWIKENERRACLYSLLGYRGMERLWR